MANTTTVKIPKSTIEKTTELSLQTYNYQIQSVKYIKVAKFYNNTEEVNN